MGGEQTRVDLNRAGASAIRFAAEVSYKAALAEIRTQIPPREKVSTSIEIPFTEPAKRTLYAAAREADALAHSYIGTEHLLLGLLNLEGGTTKAILERYGLRLDDARREIRQRAGRAFNAAPPSDGY
jgi:ATP-dependent Clp protease ATP-binding subunit ClpC